MNLFKSLPAVGLGLGLTAILLLLRLWGGGPADLLERKTYDRWMALRAPREAPVILVGMEASGREEARSTIAEAVARIRAGGPKVIGLALDLSRPEGNRGLKAVQELKKAFATSLLAETGKTGAAFLAQIEAAEESLAGDRRLARVLSAAGKVVLPIRISAVLPGRERLLPAAEPLAAPGDFPSAQGVELPLPMLLAAAGAAGHDHILTDPDGRVRRNTAFCRFAGDLLPSFPLALAALYLDVSPADILVRPGKRVRIGALEIPLTPASELLVPAAGTVAAWKRVRFEDVVAGTVHPRAFKDKLVLVVTAADGGLGGERIAAAAAAILTGSVAGRPFWAPAAEAAALVLAGLWVAFGFSRLGPLRSGGVSILLVLLTAGVGTYLFVFQGIWIKAVDLCLLLGLGFLGNTLLHRFLPAIHRPAIPEPREAAEDDLFRDGLGEALPAEGGGEVLPSLGRYQVIRKLGQGSMGVVYLGKDPRIHRLTAIKTFSFFDDVDPDALASVKQKFFAEAESAGNLSHPHIVTIFDAGEEAGLAYIAMEYLEGETLKTFTHPGRLLPQRRVIDHMADIAEALDYAHASGVVHRDIKPANIMLLNSGTVKITDFGVARITATSRTRTGVVKGTPFYMSPEQISGAKVDGRSDIFALGVMMFQLLTGRLPFTGNSLAALMHQIVQTPCPDPRIYNPRILKPLGLIVQKALTKEKEKRYQRAGQLAAHLRELGKRLDAAAGARRPA